MNEFDGARYLWGEADLGKLPSLPAYMDRMADSNFGKLADLAAFFHNNEHYALRDSCLARARRVKGFELQFQQLTDLIKQRKKFDYASYSELLFGGAY